MLFPHVGCDLLAFVALFFWVVLCVAGVVLPVHRPGVRTLGAPSSFFPPPPLPLRFCSISDFEKCWKSCHNSATRNLAWNHHSVVSHLYSLQTCIPFTLSCILFFSLLIHFSRSSFSASWPPRDLTIDKKHSGNFYFVGDWHIPMLKHTFRTTTTNHASAQALSFGKTGLSSRYCKFLWNDQCACTEERNEGFAPKPQQSDIQMNWGTHECNCESFSVIGNFLDHWIAHEVQNSLKTSCKTNQSNLKSDNMWCKCDSTFLWSQDTHKALHCGENLHNIWIIQPVVWEVQNTQTVALYQMSDGLGVGQFVVRNLQGAQHWKARWKGKYQSKKENNNYKSQEFWSSWRLWHLLRTTDLN